MSNDLTLRKASFKLSKIKLKSWENFFSEIAMILFNGAIGQIPEASIGLVKVLQNFEVETTEEELAWNLVSRAMIRSFADLIQENCNNFIQISHSFSGKEFKKRNIELKEIMEELFGEREISISKDFFRDPANQSIVKDSQDLFSRWLVRCGFTDERDARSISECLPSFFVFSLNDEWRKDKVSYRPILDYFDNPFADATRHEEDWFRYRSYWRKQTHTAVFGRYSLSQLYIPLNAAYDIRSENADDDKQQEVVDLTEALLCWMETINYDDAVRVICGDPGSGKSCFAKIFMSALSDNKKVLYIPMHRIVDSGADVITSIGNLLRDDFQDNPLDVDGEMLIIFDGLDELMQIGGRYSQAAYEFIEKVDRQIIRNNNERKFVRVIYTGRLVLTQALKHIFRTEEQVLTLLPFFIPIRDRKNYHNNELLNNDKRIEWWIKYGKLSGNNYTAIPSALQNNKLSDITKQPLLNYLVALIFESKSRDVGKLSNLNSIYELIIKQVYKRDWEKQPFAPIKRMDENDYHLVLEAIAVSAWHSAGRSTTVNEIVSHCAESEFPIKWEDFRENAELGAGKFLTAFYFQQAKEVKDGDKLFEFTHNSFREYLTAKRIVRVLDLMLGVFDDQEKKPHIRLWPEDTALKIWRKLCSATRMDSDLYRFISNEIELQDCKKIVKWQKMLCKLIGYVAPFGIPVGTTRQEPEEEERLSRNTGIALLMLHGACSSVTKKVFRIYWKERTTAGKWLTHLRGQRTPWNAHFYKCLCYFWLEECVLNCNDFYEADLTGANLQQSELNFALLYNSTIEYANLDGASLRRANLQRANISGAKLRGSNLADADLTGATLGNALINNNTNLSGARTENTIGQFQPEKSDNL